MVFYIVEFFQKPFVGFRLASHICQGHWTLWLLYIKRLWCITNVQHQIPQLVSPRTGYFIKYSNFSPLQSISHQTETVQHQTEIIVYKSSKPQNLNSLWVISYGSKIFPSAIGDHLEVPWKFQYDTCCFRWDLELHNLEALMVHSCFYLRQSEQVKVWCISFFFFFSDKFLTWSDRGRKQKEHNSCQPNKTQKTSEMQKNNKILKKPVNPGKPINS